ncbi:MAG: flagellar basal-body rod protein FlgG [Deltaproteobacteria bacterium]|nr:flagellar basal-body rod protein FlgG [Deltaproteobacteria bacterium]
MSLNALYAAATGMDAQMTKMNNISNNISNMNTSGYKASKESFEDLMYQDLKAPGTKNGANTISPVGIQLGSGTHLTGVYKNFTEGELTQSNRELDIAIQGNGFFEVTQDNGDKAYTRDGSFRVNADGVIVTNAGYVVQPSITIPNDATSVTIAKDGTVTAILAGSTAAQEIGKMQVSLFRNPSGLKALGGNLLIPSDASGTATAVTPGQTGSGTLNQGFLESSNVNIAEELINMIVAQRTYEANSKVMTTANEMMKTSTNII